MKTRDFSREVATAEALLRGEDAGLTYSDEREPAWLFALRALIGRMDKVTK
jgi:hypothetical protein